MTARSSGIDYIDANFPDVAHIVLEFTTVSTTESDNPDVVVYADISRADT